MLKTIRVILVPNNKQKTKMFQYANTARFAYNCELRLHELFLALFSSPASINYFTSFLALFAYLLYNFQLNTVIFCTKSSTIYNFYKIKLIVIILLSISKLYKK